jgi:hypothetical protein
MLQAHASAEPPYVPFHSARMRSQLATRREALLVVLVTMAAALTAAAYTATWANSSIRLQIIDEFVGQWARREPEHRLVGATPVAASPCATMEGAAFADEFASLSRAIGDIIGQPLECARADPATGDVLQPTSTGLAIYRGGSHLAIFTDGYRHWALGSQGLVTWEGDAVDPPG